MRFLAAFLLVVSTVFSSSVRAEDTPAVSKAKVAARTWLSSVDAGLYGKSWEEMAVPVQKAVSKAQLEAALTSARAPLGELRNRSVISATYADSLPGAPKGEYVVIRYVSEFTKQAEVVETVTPMLDADGTWRVSGYFAK